MNLDWSTLFTSTLFVTHGCICARKQSVICVIDFTSFRKSGPRGHVELAVFVSYLQLSQKDWKNWLTSNFHKPTQVHVITSCVHCYYMHMHKLRHNTMEAVPIYLNRSTLIHVLHLHCSSLVWTKFQSILCNLDYM